MKLWQSRSGGHICLRLDRGEELVESVQKVAAEKGLLAASVTGIGAIANSEIAYFDPAKKEYQRVVVEESMELLSLTGNVAIREDKPFAHLHAVISGPDCIAKGGHLFRGVVSVTAEIFITAFPVPVLREMNEEIGLALMAR